MHVPATAATAFEYFLHVMLAVKINHYLEKLFEESVQTLFTRSIVDDWDIQTSSAFCLHSIRGVVQEIGDLHDKMEAY